MKQIQKREKKFFIKNFEKLLEKGKTLLSAGLIGSVLLFSSDLNAQTRNAWLKRINEVAKGKVEYANMAVYEEERTMNMVLFGEGKPKEMPKEEIQKVKISEDFKRVFIDSAYINKEIDWVVYGIGPASVKGPPSRYDGPFFDDGMPKIDVIPPKKYYDFTLMTVFVVLRFGFEEDPRIDKDVKKRYYDEIYHKNSLLYEIDKYALGPIEGMGTTATAGILYKISFLDLYEKKVVSPSTLTRLKHEPPIAIFSSSVDKYAPDLVDTYIIYKHGVLVLSPSDDTMKKKELTTYPPDRFMTALTYVTSVGAYFPVEIDYFELENVKAFGFDSENSVLLIATDKGQLVSIRPKRNRVGSNEGYISGSEEVLYQTYEIGKNLINPKIELISKNQKETIFELRDNNLAYPILVKIKAPTLEHKNIKYELKLKDGRNATTDFLNDIIEPWEIIDKNKMSGE